MKTNIRKLLALSVLLSFLLCMGGGNAYAQNKISGGDQLQKRVSLQVTNAPVAKVFAEIEAKSGVQIVFNASEIGKLPPVLNPHFAPFEFKTIQNGKDTIVGADVEIAKAIADELGVKVKFSEMSFDNVLANVQSEIGRAHV